MFTARNFIYSAVALSVISCGGSSSSDNSNDLELPSFVSLIQEQQTASPSKNFSAKSALSQVVPLAVADPLPGAGTDYDNFESTTYGVQSPADASTKIVNSALCFVDQANPELNIGSGAYRTLIDEDRCFDESEGEEASAYKDVIIEVANIAQSNNKQIDLWWDDSATIKNRVRIIVSENISTTNPYGAFKLYLVRTINVDETNESSSHLHLDIGPNPEDPTEYILRIIGNRDISIEAVTTQAYAIAALNGSTGASKLLESGNNYRQVFDETYIHTDKLNGLDEKCFNLSEIKEDVYGYELFYNQVSGLNVVGDRVDLTAGISFSYDNGTKRGWVDGNSFWSESSFTENVSTLVTGDDGETYNITVQDITDPDQQKVIALTKNVAGGTPVTVTLNAPLVFNYTVANADERNQAGVEAYDTNTNQTSLAYFGKGSMPFIVTDSTDNNPKLFSLKDGVELTSDGINYVVKAASISQRSDAITASFPAECTNLSLSDAEFSDEFAELVFTSEINSTFSSLSGTTPVVTTAVKYIAGEAVAAPTDL